jgi:hypothetical protein
MELAEGDLQLMRLAVRDAGADGWTEVGEQVWPMVSRLPDDFVEKRRLESGCHIKVTNAGHALLKLRQAESDLDLSLRRITELEQQIAACEHEITVCRQQIDGFMKIIQEYS